MQIKALLRTALVLGCLALSALVQAGQRWDVNLGFDSTGSVPAKQYALYPKLARTAALYFLQTGDRLSLLSINGADAVPIELDDRLSKFSKQVVEVDSMLKRTPQDARKAPGGSDFGLLFNHVADRIELNRSLNAKGRKPLNVVVAITDGVADGKQTLKTRDTTIREDYRILFLGIKSGTEEFLLKTAAAAGFIDTNKILLVPFQNSQELDFSKFLGRSRNPDLERDLTRADLNVGKSR